MTFQYSDISLSEYPGETSLILYSPGCNFYCPWCFTSELRKKEPISFKQAKDAVDEHIDFITAVVLSGGEPYYNPELFRIIKYVREKGLKVKINTNGFLSEQRTPWFTHLYTFVDYLHISLKDPTYCICLNDSRRWSYIHSQILEYSFVYIKECYPKSILKQMVFDFEKDISDDWFIDFFDKKYRKPDIFTVSQLQTGSCLNPEYNNCKTPTRDELIEVAKLFKNIPKKQLIVETKEFGRENILKKI